MCYCPESYSEFIFELQSQGSTIIILIEDEKKELCKALDANICKYCAIIALGSKLRNTNEIIKSIQIAYFIIHIKK